MTESYIELDRSNLYASGIVLELNDNSFLLERKSLIIHPEESDRWHRVKYGDELDSLSHKYYSNIVDDAAKYWWFIAEANGVTNPLDISDLVGTYLLIPEFFRVTRLIQQVEGGLIQYESELDNKYVLIDNPPTPLSVDDTLRPPVDGIIDVTTTPKQWAFFKSPNGGYLLLTANMDNENTLDVIPANPDNYDNPVIFEHE